MAAPWLSKGIALAGYYVDYKLKEAKVEEELEELKNARMRYHFDSNQKTCNATVQSLLPSLKHELSSELDCDTLVLKLKSVNSAEEKLEVWNELKIVAFTRAVTGVYVFCFLVVFLRVQLNVIGRHMYIDSMDKLEQTGKISPSLSPRKNSGAGSFGNTSEIGQSLSAEEQKQYLMFAQYGLGEGLKKIVSCVLLAVKRKLGKVSLKTMFSEMDLRRLIDDIRFDVESEQSSLSVSKFWEYVFPGEGNEKEFLCREMKKVSTGAQSANSPAFDSVVRETRKLIQNADYTIVLENCLGVLFNTLIHNLDPFFRESIAEAEGTLPLAKVVPLMTGQLHSMFETPENENIEKLSALPILEQYSAIIYTSFEAGGA